MTRLTRISRAVSATSTVVGVILSGVLLASPASAAEPANHACFGADLSGYARLDAPHGRLVSSLARNAGIGNLVQLHQAGQLADADFPNTCND
ncbi:MAG: hypothetical protein ACRDT6_05125 [Micromonosporaceae bacterium]